ncbi:hypothetical protein MMC29_002340 [Sticta canariensis]|nr:hypothetical protein [Sticta canariensis]
MATSVQENLVKKNNEYASTFKEGDLALPPAKKYAVVTCMDARIDPASAYGISLGDAHVIRNAGASARDAIRSIVISQQLLGTNEVLLIKHSGCGMLTFKNEDAHKVVETNLGTDGAQELAGLDFLPFPDLDEAVRDDVAYLRGSKAVAESVTVSGWVYEVETGKVRAVN